MKARENPFRSARIDALPFRSPGFAWDRIERSLDTLGGRGAVVGPQGHGKSTLLRAWCARRTQCGDRTELVRIAWGQRRPHPGLVDRLAGLDWVFLDGAEQLDRHGWRELLQRLPSGVRLAATIHEPGLLPTVMTCSTSAGLLEELVWELTGERIDASGLWKRHRGNLRLALWELYDQRARV